MSQLPQEGAKGITASQIMAQAGFPCARARAVEPALLLFPKNSLCDFLGSPFPEINSASKTTLLRSRPQFVPYGYLLSNKDKTVRGRQSKLKSTVSTPHGICFAQQKKFVNHNFFREEGPPPLRAPICLLLKAYCS